MLKLFFIYLKFVVYPGLLEDDEDEIKAGNMTQKVGTLVYDFQN